jgi:hypothetical protein
MPAGTVWFWEGELQPDNVVRLSLDTRRLVAEGIQRSHELRKFLGVLDDPSVRLARASSFDGELAGLERTIVEAVGPERPFAALCSALSLEREAAARSIQLLRLVGAVKLVRSSTTMDPPDAEEAESLHRQAVGGTKLLATLRAVVVDADRNASVDERLARVFDDALARFPALLTGLRFTDGCGLDPEQLAVRAAKLPDARTLTLHAALAEFAAYLEFEIMNHPQIADPEALLSGLAPLRQMLAG